MLPAMALPKAVPDFGSLNPQEISQEIPRIRQCIIRNMCSCNLRDDILYVCDRKNPCPSYTRNQQAIQFLKVTASEPKLNQISNRFRMSHRDPQPETKQTTMYIYIYK